LFLHRQNVNGYDPAHIIATSQAREDDLTEQHQKLKVEKREIEEDVRQMVLMMEDRRAELTKQRESFEQVSVS
jgi:hypothetical protein